MRGNARQSEPHSVPRGIVRTILEPVILSSMTKQLRRITEGEGQLQPCQALILSGARVMGAE